MIRTQVYLTKRQRDELAAIAKTVGRNKRAYSRCRKFHGNYGAYTSVKVENLNIIEQQSLKWYRSHKDETANVHRGFCSECGSSLFWHPKDQPNIAIAAGSLDTPTHLKTKGHIWCSQISDYYKIEDGLPQFDERWSLT
jgi:hypothetical protein